MKILGFDACGEMTCDTLEDWVRFTQDPDFVKFLFRMFYFPWPMP